MRGVIYVVVRRLLAVAVLMALLGSSYFFLIRPAQLRWGATSEEVARPMPEDNIVADPVFDATRAITIRARPEQIWPWLAQMGFGRAGFYGYDLIEGIGSKTGIRSANTIVPELQHPTTGDPLPISMAATLVYGSINPNEWMVWRSQHLPSDGVFIWELVPVDENHTRLISRIRWNYAPGLWFKTLGVFTEFADHVAVRRILKGIRDRAEGRPPESLAGEAVEIAGWILALLELCIATVFAAFGRHWKMAWLLALGAGVLLQFLLYGDAPVWICAALPWFYLGFMVWRWRMDRARNIEARRAAPAITMN
jgi:hypothetical protein